ncbi:MAG: methyltransferase domain-containing protein [Pseudomonadota bacterium]
MTANHDQAEYWTTQTSWVREQDAMDACLQPVLDGVIARANLASGEHVLDIGCGTGASLLAASTRVGAAGRVFGADISPALLGLATQRTAGCSNIQTQEVDAQSGDLGQGYDVCLSRFGVMFFEDSTAAFANIARAVKPDGRFALGVWGDARQNPYFMDAARAAHAVFGEMPKVDRTLPGPFAFEDPARVRPMLEAAGLKDVTIMPTQLDLTPRGDLGDFADLCFAIGPAARALAYFEADASGKAKLRDALIDIYSPYQTGQAVRIPAMINFITARA